MSKYEDLVNAILSLAIAFGIGVLLTLAWAS